MLNGASIDLFPQWIVISFFIKSLLVTWSLQYMGRMEDIPEKALESILKDVRIFLYEDFMMGFLWIT